MVREFATTFKPSREFRFDHGRRRDGHVLNGKPRSFERKQVSERVGANFHSRSSRGLYNGGCVPIGYRLNPDEKGRLLIDLESSPTVKKVFQTFLEQGTLSKTARHLNEKGFYFRPIKEGGRGLKKGLGHFTFQNVHAILKNPNYIAIKKFKAKGVHGNGGKIPYYDHGSIHRLYQCTTEKPKNCFPTRVMAKVIEPLVWEERQSFVKDKVKTPVFMSGKTLVF